MINALNYWLLLLPIFAICEVIRLYIQRNTPWRMRDAVDELRSRTMLLAAKAIVLCHFSIVASLNRHVPLLKSDYLGAAIGMLFFILPVLLWKYLQHRRLKTAARTNDVFTPFEYNTAWAHAFWAERAFIVLTLAISIVMLALAIFVMTGLVHIGVEIE